jgi:hypothetical protein
LPHRPLSSCAASLPPLPAATSELLLHACAAHAMAD